MPLALLLLLQHVWVGSSLPAKCTVGDVAHKSGAAAGSYECTATDTWSIIIPNSGGGDMLAANNLSDVANAATARTNLGVVNTTFVVTVGDTTNSTTSYADITGLSWAVAANTRYDIECNLVYSANATTTGIGIGWTGPASPTLTGALMVSGITGATVGGTTIVGNDTGSVTTASVATTGNFVSYHGFWSNGANAGTVQMRFKSEVAVASAIVIKAGSYCKYTTY